MSVRHKFNRFTPVESVSSIVSRNLPCLYSGISIESLNSVQNLTPHGKKSSFVLKSSVQLLAEQHGLERLGFLTLTFADHILCPKQAQKRFNSLVTNVIKPRYREYVGVLERQRTGRIHYHLLVVLDSDIRTGFDFSSLKNHDYSSASTYLRSEWAFWRSTAKKYGFGRTELLPVRSTSDAIAKYVGKYISKHTEARLDCDKGVRLVRYSKGARAGTTRFQFLSDGSRSWRDKCKVFAEIIGDRVGVEITPDNISDYLGKRWAYNNKDFIMSLP